jgi:hypothetical protein
VIWEEINDVELEVDEFADLFSKAEIKPKEKKVPAVQYTLPLQRLKI